MYLDNNMKKGVWVILIVLTLIISAIVIFPKTGFVTQSLNANNLENLRQKAEVECLQNSQCPENSSCVGNKCIDKKEIDLCQSVSLSTPTRKIKKGDSINSIKEVLTKAQLPFLLSDGELVEEINNELIKHFYIQIILIGEDKIEKENQDYLIENNQPIYTYRLIFSNGVDFSDKNIQGQVLGILGEEYTISSNSDNSNIYLVSKNKKIVLKDSEDIKITQNEEGKIIMIEISFFSNNKIKTKENHIDSVFNKIKFSFNNADDNSADVRIGGSC